MKKKALLFLLMHIGLFAFSQIPDSTKNLEPGLDSMQKTAGKKMALSSAVSLTNNGISLIPTFSLDKPASIFDLSISKSRFGFDPEFAFSLYDGKPWYFLFWFRYKVADSKKFKLTAGTHLGLNFVRAVLPVNGDSGKVLLTQRYIVGELVPTYIITRDISVGLYYLVSHGMDRGTTNLTHFLTLNANFSHVPLSHSLYLKWVPQFYYLKIDRDDGFYFTSSFTLAKQQFPVSLSAVINKAIHSNIHAGGDFVWNLSLTWSF